MPNNIHNSVSGVKVCHVQLALVAILRQNAVHFITWPLNPFLLTEEYSEDARRNR